VRTGWTCAAGSPPASVPFHLRGSAAAVLVRPGDVVRLDGRASAQFAGDRAISLRVIAVDSLPTYTGWLWLTGHELTASGEAGRRREVFVQAAVLSPTRAGAPRREGCA
jgi:hypothetical protein